MGHYLLNDEFFSPVRIDNSTIDESSDGSLSLDGSISDLANAEKYFLGNVKNKADLENQVTKSAYENELKSEDKNLIKTESENTCTPVLNKNSVDKSNVKRHSSLLKLEKLKETKEKDTVKKRLIKQPKTQEPLSKESNLDYHAPKSNITEKHQKRSRTSDLLSKNENTRLDSLKDIKKKDKSNNQSSKCHYEDAMFNNPSNSVEGIDDTKFKDSSVLSTESKKNASEISEDKKSTISSQQKEKNIVNPLPMSYEATIKAIVHNSIGSESAKIRQLIYMQQMSFYREMNKIKDKMENQHLVTQKRLFKVIEELFQVNATLKLALSKKDDHVINKVLL